MRSLFNTECTACRRGYPCKHKVCRTRWAEQCQSFDRIYGADGVRLWVGGVTIGKEKETNQSRAGTDRTVVPVVQAGPVVGRYPLITHATRPLASGSEDEERALM